MLKREKLKYGMIGGGSDQSVGKIHRNALRLNDDAELVAGAFSRDYKKTKELSRAFGLSDDRIYVSHDDMSARESERADGIDFVVICTPNAYHYQAAKDFLSKGIHVVCDTPLCFTIEEGRKLKQIAEENNCLFCLTYTFTGYTTSRDARKRVQNGEIGEIRSVVVEYPQGWLIDKLELDDKNWRSKPELSGRGASIANIGSHMENWVNYVTGLKIDKVLANLDAIGQGTMLDNSFQVIAKYNNGATGLFWGSQVAIGFENAFHVTLFGEKGSLEFWQEDCNNLTLRLRDEPVQRLSRGAVYSGDEPKKQLRTPPGHPEGLTEALANIYSSFCEQLHCKKQGIISGDYDYPNIDMGIDCVKFFNACVDSHQAGNVWVELK